MPRQLQTAAARLEDTLGGAEVRDGLSEIPNVCFLTDVCRILRISLSTAKRLRRHGAFPIAELPALDKRPRWSGDAVKRWLAGEGQMGRSAWRRRAV